MAVAVMSIASASGVNAQPRAAYESYTFLDEDLQLSPQQVFDISQRAIRDATTGQHSGFMNWVAHSTECYASLTSADIAQRIYCLQFDAVAMTFERGLPQAWRERDELSNDYFTERNFLRRQSLHAPPLAPVAHAQARREAVLDALALVLRHAMEAWLVEQRSQRGE